MAQDFSAERTVVVHQAGSAVEAVVIRGLLESAGIPSPGAVLADPFPMREPPEGFAKDTDIVVLESQAEAARQVIADYLSSNEGIQVEEGGEETPPEG